MNSFDASPPALPEPKHHKFLTPEQKRSLVNYLQNPLVRQSEVTGILRAFRLDQTSFEAMRRTHYGNGAVPSKQSQTRKTIFQIVPEKSLQIEQIVSSVPAEHPLSQKFGKIYTELFDAIKFFVLSKISMQTWEREQRAEDLTHDAFLKLFVVLQDDEDSIHDPKAWLMRVARNMLVDSSRRSDSRKRQETVVDHTESAEADPAQQVASAEISGKLHQEVLILMSKLHASDRVVFLQRADDTPSKDVAASVRSSAAAVDMSYSRSRDYFRKALIDKYPEFVFDFLGAERTHSSEGESTD